MSAKVLATARAARAGVCYQDTSAATQFLMRRNGDPDIGHSFR